MRFQERYSREIEQDFNSFHISDVDGDGNEDLLCDRKRGILWAKIASGQIIPIREGQYERSGYVYSVCDATGDGHPECFVTMDTPEGTYIACHDWFSQHGFSQPIYELGPFHPPLNRGTYTETSIFIMNCFDANRDGKPEIYVAFNSNYSEPYPRSLMVFDGPSGRLLERYDMGPHLKNCRLVDATGDEPLVVVSTFASGNLARWNETSDTLSYVFCFTPHAKREWLRPITGRSGWTDIDVCDHDNNGLEEILVTRHFGPDELELSRKDYTWSVALLDPYNGGAFFHQISLYTGTDQPFSSDLDGDVIPEMLVVGQNSYLYILESDLKLRTKLDDRTTQRIHHIIDLDMDGSKEIVCSGDGLLMIRDKNGILTAEMPFSNDRNSSKVEIADIADTRYIVALNDNYIRYYTYERQPFAGHLPGFLSRIAASRFGWVVFILFGCIIGILGTLAMLSNRRRSRAGREASGVNGFAENELLSAMVAFGHGGSSLKTLNRIRFYLKNRRHVPEKNEKANDTFRGLARSFAESVIPDLHGIARLAKKANVAAEYSRGLVSTAEGAKALVNRISKGAITNPDAPQEIIRQAMSDLDTIDRWLAGIRSHLRSVFTCNAPAITSSALSKRNAELEKLGITPIMTVAGAFDGNTFVASNIFEKIIDGLIDNAIRSMERIPSPKLEITVGVDEPYCRIDITDNGTGIAEKDVERVFDRHYTTKREGGFGLHYAREELARFGGRIFVRESSPGEGTTFRIVLRTVH